MKGWVAYRLHVLVVLVLGLAVLGGRDVLALVLELKRLALQTVIQNQVAPLRGIKHASHPNRLFQAPLTSSMALK